MSLLDGYNALQVVQGASKGFEVTITSDTGVPENLTGARILLSVKGVRIDGVPTVRKDSEASPATITILDPLAGTLRIDFVPADTHDLDPGLYVYDLWVLFQDGRRVPVIPESTLEVLPTITRIPL